MMALTQESSASTCSVAVRWTLVIAYCVPTETTLSLELTDAVNVATGGKGVKQQSSNTVHYQFEYTFAYIDIDRAVPDAQLIDTMADTGPELEHDDSISSQDPHNKKTKKIKNRRPASAST